MKEQIILEKSCQYDTDKFHTMLVKLVSVFEPGEQRIFDKEEKRHKA